jgi:hypothetical protein
MHVRTSLVAFCASFALAVTVSPAWAAQPKQSPTAPDQAGRSAPPNPKHHKFSQLSKSEKAAIKLAARLDAKATKGRVLDYKRANKYDRGEVLFRRKFTAGWLSTGGKVVNISRNERKKVHRFIPKGDKYWMLPKNSFGVPQCSGKTKYVQRGRVGRPGYRAESWYNSCDTAKLLWVYGATSLLLGGVAMYPPITAVAGPMSVLMGLGVLYVTYRRDLSKMMAVYTWHGNVRFGCRSQ